MNQDLTYKIQNCKSMKDLDALRPELAKQMMVDGVDGYRVIQKVFINKKNQLLRIPRKDRL